MNKTKITAFVVWASFGFSLLAQNLIVNGSFEQPVIGSIPYGEPDSWFTVGSQNDRPSIIYDHVNAAQSPLPQDGHQYISVGTEGDGTHDNVQQTFTVTNGGIFLLTWFDALPTNAGPQLSFYSVTLFDKSGSVAATNSFNAYHSTLGWQARSMQFVLASGTNTLRLQGEVAPSGWASLLDNVSLIQDDSDLVANIASAVNICWPGRTNQTYQVQYRTNLSDTNWFNFGSPIFGQGTNCVTDIISGIQQRFYRIIRLP